ncbi:hypothetical protein BDR04DRAFT_598549 [Suillus decipiens]|nr:hypothetical protein BDR04DRAFT_598549 [Suillus decipiens]
MKSNSVLHFLQLAPNLSSLTVCIFFEDFQALEPVMRTKLHTLCITYENADILPPGHSSDMFNTLSLPALRELAVYGLPTWPHEVFKASVARSTCLLESLIVDGGDAWVTFEQSEEYIALVSSLRSAAYRKGWCTSCGFFMALAALKLTTTYIYSKSQESGQSVYYLKYTLMSRLQRPSAAGARNGIIIFILRSTHVTPESWLQRIGNLLFKTNANNMSIV